MEDSFRQLKMVHGHFMLARSDSEILSASGWLQSHNTQSLNDCCDREKTVKSITGRFSEPQEFIKIARSLLDNDSWILPWQADELRNAWLPFKIPDSARRRTLIDVDALSGASEAQFLSESNEVAHVPQLHH